MNQKYLDFTLEEYKNVTKEISSIMSEIFELEKYSIVVFGGIYVFLFNEIFGNVSEILTKIIMALPVITTFVFGLLIYSRYLRAKLLAEYIKSRYETSFGIIGDAKIGYETFLANELKKRNSAIFITRVLSWVIQILVAIIVCIVYYSEFGTH